MSVVPRLPYRDDRTSGFTGSVEGVRIGVRSTTTPVRSLTLSGPGQECPESQITHTHTFLSSGGLSLPRYLSRRYPCSDLHTSSSLHRRLGRTPQPPEGSPSSKRLDSGLPFPLNLPCASCLRVSTLLQVVGVPHRLRRGSHSSPFTLCRDLSTRPRSVRPETSGTLS